MRDSAKDDLRFHKSSVKDDWTVSEGCVKMMKYGKGSMKIPERCDGGSLSHGQNAKASTLNP